MITIENLSIGHTLRHRSVVVAHGLTARCLPGSLTCDGSQRHGQVRCCAPSPASCLRCREVSASWAATRGNTPAGYARLVSVVLTSRPYGQNITVGELVALGRTPLHGFLGDALAGRQGDSCRVDAPCGHKRSRRPSCGDAQRRRAAEDYGGEGPGAADARDAARRTHGFLDYPSKVELMTLLRRLAEERRLTILVSTHDLEIALRTAHRLWILSDRGTLRGCAGGDEGEVERSFLLGVKEVFC